MSDDKAPKEFTFDEICESQDFEHEQAFVLKEAYLAVCEKLAAAEAERGLFSEAIADAREAINARSEDLVVDIEWLKEERDELQSKLDIARELSQPETFIEGQRQMYAQTAAQVAALKAQLAEWKADCDQAENGEVKWAVEAAKLKSDLAEKDARIEALEAEITRLENVHDMDRLIATGLQRILAVARMVNNAKPDIRMTHALEAYDKNKLPTPSIAKDLEIEAAARHETYGMGKGDE